MPPSVPLVVVMVLILAQVFHVISPNRITYWRRLLLAALGVAAGEFLGRQVVFAGPRMGELHPLWEIAGTTVLQLLGNRFLRR